MTQPRAADNFAAICARMKELRRQRERAEAAEIESRGGPTTRSRPNRPLAARRSARGRDGSVNPDQTRGPVEIGRDGLGTSRLRTNSASWRKRYVLTGPATASSVSISRRVVPLR
jgi:hypothetical protein